MIKVLIVDDEKIIREGLRKIISENCADLEIVGEASNGKDALEISLQVIPDIAIIDIRMPIMDGLEYLRKIKRELPDIKAIILSGYADFSYARESLNLGSSYYCLKPLRHTELIGELNKLREDIILEKQKAEREAMNENSIKESNIHRRDLFLSRLIKNELSPDYNINEKIGLYNLYILNKMFFLAVVDVDDFYTKIKRISHDIDDSKEYLLLPLVRKIQEVIDENTMFYGISFSSNYREIVVIVSHDSNTASKETNFAVQSLFGKIQEVLMRYQDTSVTIGYYGLCDNISLISSGYECAREAVQKRFKNGSGKIFIYNKAESEIIAYPLNEEREFIASLESGEKSNMVIHLDNIMKYLGDEKVDRDNCVSMLCRLYMIVQQHLISLNAQELLQCLPSNSNFEKYIAEMDFFHSMRLYVYDIFDKIYEGMKVILNDTTRKVVRVAKDYVEKNYNKDLSLYEVALHVNMNPNYLSILFKKEIGDTFTDYLIKLKIEKAKTLLKESTFKTHEIAVKVGYNDPKHFSKIFKKIVGVTPTEYREM